MLEQLAGGGDAGVNQNVAPPPSSGACGDGAAPSSAAPTPTPKPSVADYNRWSRVMAPKLSRRPSQVSARSMRPKRWLRPFLSRD